MSVIQWDVPLIGQRDELTCWEAVGHMMWLFRHPGDETGYRKTGGRLLDEDRGLNVHEVDTFYRGLGMLAHRESNWSWIGHKIIEGPIAAILDKGEPAIHQVILVGRSGDAYCIVDPEGELDFSEDDSASIKARRYKMNRSEISLNSILWWWPRLPHNIAKKARLHWSCG